VGAASKERKKDELENLGRGVGGAPLAHRVKGKNKPLAGRWTGDQSDLEMREKKGKNRTGVGLSLRPPPRSAGG